MSFGLSAPSAGLLVEKDGQDIRIEGSLKFGPSTSFDLVSDPLVYLTVCAVDQGSSRSLGIWRWLVQAGSEEAGFPNSWSRVLV